MLLLIAALLLLSAFFSGSETAYFSLTPQDIDRIRREETKPGKRALVHLSNPDRLLGIVLLGNNFVNVAIVLLATFFIDQQFTFTGDALRFLVQTVVVTFLLAFFGEVLPKTFAAQYARQFAERMSFALHVLSKVFSPFTWILVRFTSRINKGLSMNRGGVSIDELSQAVDITEQQSSEETKMLKGIVRLVNIDVRQIMHPRVNVSAVDINMDFVTVREKMIDCGYSRIPVYDKTPDRVKGILYVKDLLAHLYTADEKFAWQQLIREAYFVPENKKINDLLEEFRRRKIHVAVVVDEYGGTEGIVTLEDILEEIVGEISDETD